MKLIDTVFYGNVILLNTRQPIMIIKGRYKSFSNRLIDAMKSNGHVASRSPSGICISTLSKFAGASEQICRHYIRGDGLPDYEKVINIAAHLNVTPGWLLFGEPAPSQPIPHTKPIDDELLHYILNRSHLLYQEETEQTDNYADFVLGLVREVREINTSSENLLKIINLAIGSISSFTEKRRKSAIL